MVHKTEKPGVMAIFQYFDQFTEVLEKIQTEKKFAGHEIYSPVSYHELMDHAEKLYGPSEVRWFTLVGALTGIASGFALPLGMDWDWPIVVGGKTAGIYSMPAYFIFVFELMVLFGAIATIMGMLVLGRIPNPEAKIRDKRLSDDRFGIFVPGVSVDSEQAQMLKQWGAEDVYAST